MRELLPKLTNITAGERCQLWAYITVAFFGMGFGLIVILRLDSSALFTRSLNLYECWILVSGAVGTCAGLRFSRERLGRQGIVNTIIGMGVVTFAGSVIAGTLALPLYGTMFGPFTLVIIFWAVPITAILWFTSLAGVHFMMMQWHIERDSIFGPHRPQRFEFIDDLMRDLRIR